MFDCCCCLMWYVGVLVLLYSCFVRGVGVCCVCLCVVRVAVACKIGCLVSLFCARGPNMVCFVCLMCLLSRVCLFVAWCISCFFGVCLLLVFCVFFVVECGCVRCLLVR